MADSIGNITLPADLEDEDAAGDAARAALGDRLYCHAATEFDIPGIHFGVFYADSPVVVPDGAPAPPDEWHRYTPNATPGARAPHVWLGDGVSIFDRFGRDFTLVRFNPRAASETIEAAAKKRGLPLAVIDVASDEARDLYARDLVLVRPDHHIAWRGNSMPADAEMLLARVAGHA
jgi:hypothetical protein